MLHLPLLGGLLVLISLLALLLLEGGVVQDAHNGQRRGVGIGRPDDADLQQILALRARLAQRELRRHEAAVRADLGDEAHGRVLEQRLVEHGLLGATGHRARRARQREPQRAQPRRRHERPPRAGAAAAAARAERGLDPGDRRAERSRLAIGAITAAGPCRSAVSARRTFTFAPRAAIALAACRGALSRVPPQRRWRSYSPPSRPHMRAPPPRSSAAASPAAVPPALLRAAPPSAACARPSLHAAGAAAR
ncbi:hypothetical protein FGB62_111g033 [Gracilaria domingensis]|nr:hypothetical protein FGB62_111g033 [Gracilaria domingensis]